MSIDKEAGVYVSAPLDNPARATTGLCRKGWTSTDLLNHQERLTTPLIRNRETNILEPATWSDAIALIAGVIQRTQKNHGSDAVGVFGGGGLTNEKTYSLGKFARVVLRSGSIDYNGRFCMSSAASALNKSFGVDRGLPFPLSDLESAEIILLVGSNLSETMPPAMRVLNQQRKQGGTLVVVDPRMTSTAKSASIHLQPRPGTDLVIANGLLNIVITEGFIDEDYIDKRTNDFELAKEVALAYFPERVEKLTGVSVAQLYEVANLLGRAKSAMIITGRGAEQHANGTATVHAYINLALALGKVGRPNSGFGTMTGQGNGQGGREHGQKVDQLPGYRSLMDPSDRKRIAEIWDVDEVDLPYPKAHAFEMLSSLGLQDGVKTLIVLGSNPIVSAPNANLIDQSFRRLDFLVVVDPFLSETAKLADVVLPCAQWAEETGTMTNVEGRVLLRHQATPIPEGVKTDLEIISLLAHALGVGQKFPSDPQEIFEELRIATAGARADYSGITYEKLERQSGVFWPCRSLEDPGQERLFHDEFFTKDGRAVFIPTPYSPSSEPTDEEFPIVLTTGRILTHYQSGTQTRRVDVLNEESAEAYVEIHPVLADHLALLDGDYARLKTRRGQATFRVRRDANIRIDTVFAPFHWGGSSRANSLTNSDLDPSSAMPAFKYCAVALTKEHSSQSEGETLCRES